MNLEQILATIEKIVFSNITKFSKYDFYQKQKIYF